MAKPKKDGHPFCFRCKYFYRGEGEKYVSAHCPFQIYVGCEGRTKAVDLGEEYLKREERACGYFGMTYFHIVQKLFCIIRAILVGVPRFKNAMNWESMTHQKA